MLGYVYRRFAMTAHASSWNSIGRAGVRRTGLVMCLALAVLAVGLSAERLTAQDGGAAPALEAPAGSTSDTPTEASDSTDSAAEVPAEESPADETTEPAAADEDSSAAETAETAAEEAEAEVASEAAEQAVEEAEVDEAEAETAVEEAEAVEAEAAAEEVAEEAATDEQTAETEAAEEEAEDEEASGGWSATGMLNLALFLAVLIIPIVAARMMAKAWRMPDYEFKFFLITFCILGGVVVTWRGWPPTLGIDLRGGVILIYDIVENDTDAPVGVGGERKKSSVAPEHVDMDKMAQAIAKRINPGGVLEITIQKLGNNQIKIIIPEADEAEVARLESIISQAGTLEFRILADQRNDSDLIAEAKSSNARVLRDEDGEVEAWWVPVTKGEEAQFVGNSQIATRETEDGQMEVLVLNDIYDVTGKYLVTARPGTDETGRNAVDFTFNTAGGSRFKALTSDNQPDRVTGHKRHLGIILNRYLYSAPTINAVIRTNGQISGSFTQEEVEDLVAVLNAGSLPASLSETPVSRQLTGPTLGADTIIKGRNAIAVSAALVLIFMIFYYRFSGVVACIAVLLNLVLIFAVMITVKAAFTLPGIAGLVLTVGMAVDANVLIFERIREELDRNATLRMAIRNGFQFATRTIVDANVTTLITAVILYVIGSEQVRGFAVTLFLGVVFSMFTAIYCGRVIFDVAEKRRWISKLSMMRLVGDTKIDFMGFNKFAATFSAIVILIGLVAVGVRGKGLLDIDFVGGVSIEAVFDEAKEIGVIRETLREDGQLEDLSISPVYLTGEDATGTASHRFIINTSSPGDIAAEEFLNSVKQTLEKHFGDELSHYSMTYEVAGGPQSDSSETTRRGDLPPDSLLASADEASVLLAQAETDETAEGDDAEATELATPSTSASLIFERKVNYKTLDALLTEQIAEAVEGGRLTTDLLYRLDNSEFKGEEDNRPYKEWEIEIDAPRDEAVELLDTVQSKINATVFYPSSSTIGGAVASHTRIDAIAALLFSLIGIIAYIWVRFQRVMYGLAAVVALVHDVLVTLGAIAISAWLATPLQFLGIEEFKIGLPVLAAFLTIIGYSLNDTIVVFDRIREVRGKSPDLSRDMVNTSINQTLARTLLTSMTTLIVVVILFGWGGQGIHAFAFALVVGVLIGTYSSVFVASPVLLWMTKGGSKKGVAVEGK